MRRGRGVHNLILDTQWMTRAEFGRALNPASMVGRS